MKDRTKRFLKDNRIRAVIAVIFTLFVSCGMSIYAVIDTSQPIVVQELQGNDRYQVGYKSNGQDYFMVIITKDSLKVGDELQITKK